MLNEKFRVLGFESRDHEGKTYHSALVRDSKGNVHNVNSQVPFSADHVDKDFFFDWRLCWGKYKAGVEIASIRK